MSWIVDRYECHGCGSDGPLCTVTIPHSDRGLPRHLKGMDKFRKRVCLADNHPDTLTDWRQVEHIEFKDPDVQSS